MQLGTLDWSPLEKYRCGIGRTRRQNCRGVWRHRHLPRCLISLNVPLRMNGAVGRLVVEAEASQPGVKVRVQVNGVKSRIG